jgi:hypothetical protein
MSGEPGDAAPLVIQTGDQPFGGEPVENVERHALLATLLFHVVVGDDSGHGPPVVAAFWDGDSPVPGQRSGQPSAPAAAYLPRASAGFGGATARRGVESGAHRTGSTPGLGKTVTLVSIAPRHCALQ